MEFALILKNVDQGMAVNIADEIRTSLSGLRVHHGDKTYHVNASFGVAMMEGAEVTAGDLMANAERENELSQAIHSGAGGVSDHDRRQSHASAAVHSHPFAGSNPGLSDHCPERCFNDLLPGITSQVIPGHTLETLS